MTSENMTKRAKALFSAERAINKLDGWFLMRESYRLHSPETAGMDEVTASARLLAQALEELPISIDKNSIFAGTQRDAFARSYALINPSFRVETFSGYCDPTAVFNDIDRDDVYTEERIQKTRAYVKDTPYVRELTQTYADAADYTDEVVFFVEQVTGHVIPDMRFILKNGINGAVSELERTLEEKRVAGTLDEAAMHEYAAMKTVLQAALRLAERYRALALSMARNETDPEERTVLAEMADRLSRVPANGAVGLRDAIQSFLLLWQVMCLEQAPNPFAFSVGNADRIFEPYRAISGENREEAAALFKHFLVFFNVGDRSWAISQNILLGGRDCEGNDLTNLCTYALMDAYYDMNLPQPILSVKLHRNTPEDFYREMGRFFFTPGCLTPSVFNDDAMFAVLEKAGVSREDLPDYSVAGCQEPLIMGKDNGNTTNSWLNLGKVLELTLSGGTSAITGRTLDATLAPKAPLARLRDLEKDFFVNLEKYVGEMAKAANNATHALSHLPVPFLSTLMGGIRTGYDMRDVRNQGTKYNGSGCLIHGLTVVADAFTAVRHLLAERPQDADKLLAALQADFVGYDELRAYLLACPKFGNNEEEVDALAVEIAGKTAALVRAQKNELGNPFRPDFSTPSTHLLYGYWVGALPDGRHAREMLNYGVDPLAGDANGGMGFRVLSTWKLPFEVMCGGYASHMGIDPRYFKAKEYGDLGIEFRDKILSPLFFNPGNERLAPFYLYVNVTTPDMLRKVLADPKKYAPSGVYIMRIHGTFVNFLDLSPAIQQDIIRRLDPASTAIC